MSFRKSTVTMISIFFCITLLPHIFQTKTYDSISLSSIPNCSNPAPLFEPGVNDSDFFELYNVETQSKFLVDRKSLVADVQMCRDPNDLKKYSQIYIKELEEQVNNTQIPTIFEFLERTKIAFVEFLGKPEIYAKNFIHYERMIAALDTTFVLHGIIISLVFTCIRKLFNLVVIKPISLKMELKRTDSAKLVTSAWFFVSYTFLWLVTCKVVLLNGRDDFQRPLQIFASVTPDIGYFRKPVPEDIYWLYVIQTGFYLHALMGLFSKEDGWREDRIILCIHHLITLCLLSFSYFSRFHRIGTLVLLMHDINDIFLELGKSIVYCKFRNNHYHPYYDSAGTICYVFFVASWILTRLYWFPLKVLYTTGWGVYITHIGREAFFFTEFNILLWCLFLMHIYWSYLIGVLAVKIITGQMKNLSDIRESDVDYTLDPNFEIISKKKE